MGKARDSSTVIAEAKKRIEANFASLPIFCRERGQALHHYFAVLEGEQFKAGADPILNLGTHRAALESTFHAIPGIMQRCPSATNDGLRIERAIFREAYELFEFCRRLEIVQFNLRLAEKGQFDVFVAKLDPRITFAYASTSADEADSLFRPHELEERVGLGNDSKFDPKEHLRIIETIKESLAPTIQRVSDESIKYEYTPDLVTGATQLAQSAAAQKPWGLKPDLPLGPFTIRDVNYFWSAMQALTVVHEAAHYIAMGSNLHAWPIGSIVQLKPKAEWSDVVAKVSELSPDLVGKLLDIYTYSATVSDKTPALQPFHFVSSEQLGAPAVLIIGTDHERNFLKLLNRHPAIRGFRDAINRSKEPLALQQLEGLFPAPRFVTRKQILIPGLTDADLVVYEHKMGFVLIIQHKWLVEPDTADESAANDDELLRGVTQGRQARDYWIGNPDDLRGRMGLKRDSPISQVQAVVVSRGAEPTGFVGHTSPPIITEKAFRLLLTNQPELQAFWAVLNQRPDHAESKRRVVNTTNTVELAGYSFVYPALGIRA
jgi:hypothetical protein